jgi:hypothetical protein
MFENIAVIPMYVGILKITDSQKDMTWEQQVYFGTDYGKAHEAAFMAAREGWPDSVTELKAVVRYYHIRSDGTMAYILETEVL